MSVELKIGDEIYYCGDPKNQEKFGIVTKIEEGWIDILYENGKKDHVPHALFSNNYLGHGGTRFVKKEAFLDYENKRRTYI